MQYISFLRKKNQTQTRPRNQTQKEDQINKHDLDAIKHLLSPAGYCTKQYIICMQAQPYLTQSPTPRLRTLTDPRALILLAGPVQVSWEYCGLLELLKPEEKEGDLGFPKD